MGYKTATPVQSQVIQPILAGRDILASAQTGTGKTAAFLLPIIHKLITEPHPEDHINALIIVPTRELAIQIAGNMEGLGYFTNVSSIAIYGGGDGNSFTTEKTALTSGVDIVVCTPGRMIAHLNMGYVNLKHCSYLVLDEADRMLDMGFIHDVKKLLAALPHKRQSLFFSATMPPEIVKLAGSILKNPASVSVTPVSSTVEIINQSVYFVDKGNKNDLLLDILQDTSIKTALVFTRTKHGADKVVKMLLKASIKAEAIHGNKSQNARQTALKNFKAQTTRVLVATDIAARGIDIDELEYVINFELSNIAETYVHRIGRTGRAGAKGAAISFCDIEEKAYLKDIEKLIGKKIPVVEAHKYPMKVLHVEKAAKKPQGQSRNAGGSRPGAPAAAAKDAKPARSFDKASSGRKWYGKKNTY